MSHPIQCMRCQRKTGTAAMHMVRGKHPRVMGKCINCGAKKSRFVSGRGFFSSLKNVVSKVASNPIAQNLARLGANAALSKLSGSNNSAISGLASLGLSHLNGGRMRRIRMARAARDGIKRITGGRVRRRHRRSRGAGIYPPGY